MSHVIGLDVSTTATKAVILDAGEGRISVLSDRDRVAYVGASSDETLRKAIGLDTTVGGSPTPFRP